MPESGPIHCAATTVTTKKQCRIIAPSWWDVAEYGDFVCGTHDPSVRSEAEKKFRTAHPAVFGVGRPVRLIPACWDWPLPDLRDPEWWLPRRMKEGYTPEPGERPLSEDALIDLRRTYADPDTRGEMMVTRWQRGQCAVCAVSGERLVMDHDHVTGLIRGQLCSSCNTSEGLSSGGPWDAYRRRNPAVMLGVKARYFNAYTGEYVEPAPVLPDDRRSRNPFL